MAFKLAAFADEADSTLQGQITAMQENGISLLEIRGVDGTNIADLTNEKAKEVRKQLDDAGIQVWSLGSPYGKIGIHDSFETHLDKFKHGLELAEILGAKNIRMFSFYLPSEEPAENYTDAVMERLGKFNDAAQNTNVLLCHENEKGIFGDMASRCALIHQTFPQIKAVFDPANYIQCGQDTIQAWDLLKNYIEYMHIKDALLNGSVVPAGKGIGNIPFLLNKYKGKVLTLEPHLTVFQGFQQLEADQKTEMGPYCYESSRAAFDAAVNALKEIIS